MLVLCNEYQTNVQELLNSLLLGDYFKIVKLVVICHFICFIFFILKFILRLNLKTSEIFLGNEQKCEIFWCILHVFIANKKC